MTLDAYRELWDDETRLAKTLVTLHRSGEWLDRYCYGYALLADEWRART